MLRVARVSAPSRRVASRPAPARTCTRPVSRLYSNAAQKVPFDLIKKLREKTSAGLQDCREALIASNLDLDKAAVWLQDKAKGVVAKKATRVAAEGVIAVVVNKAGTKIGMAELLSETDFASRSDSFINAAADFANRALLLSESGNAPKDWMEWAKSSENKEAVEKLIFGLRENVQLRRVNVFEADVLGYYLHQPAAYQPPVPENASFQKLGGKFAAVGLKILGEKNPKLVETLQPFAKDLAVHVLAVKPATIERTPQSPPRRTRTEDDDDDEPDSDVLVEQEFFTDDSMTVGEALAKQKEKIKKEFNTDFVIDAFIRWETGEGIQKAEDNFADEVAKLVSETSQS